MKLIKKILLIGSSLLCTAPLQASAGLNPLRFQKAYPDFIQAVTDTELVWFDGTRMPLYDGKTNKSNQEKLDNPSLSDQIAENMTYVPGIPENTEQFNPQNDPGRIRYEPFFRKMYGDSEQEVEAKLVTVYWMPKIFGMTYPLQVTQVNNVAQKLIDISNELEELVFQHPEYKIFLDQPGGTFSWRVIANTNRLSLHSFGMTIDINFETTDYWQWDLERMGLPISEDTPLIYKNSIPWEIVPIFEKQGFIWGGKWQHYDSMHFEYRPELFETIA